VSSASNQLFFSWIEYFRGHLQNFFLFCSSDDKQTWLTRRHVDAFGPKWMHCRGVRRAFCSITASFERQSISIAHAWPRLVVERLRTATVGTLSFVDPRHFDRSDVHFGVNPRGARARRSRPGALGGVIADNPTVARAIPTPPKAPTDAVKALRAKASLVALILLGGAALFAQDPRPSFEVASIRPAAPRPAVFMPGAPGSPRACPATGCGGPGTGEPGRITFTYVTVTHLIRAAYDLEPYQLEAPGWLDEARFDVIATLPETATRDEANRMLQNLLTDRFQLKLHRETRELPVYALLVEQGGKMKASDDPSAPSSVAKGRGTISGSGRTRFEFDRLTMARFADVLAGEVDRPVIDRTGLAGQYDVRLEFAPQRATPFVSPDREKFVEIFTALTEQLGLKLEPSRGPVVLLVVDSVSRQPTEN
jgi:uncharacterized protein (TIGR03435 family)